MKLGRMATSLIGILCLAGCQRQEVGLFTGSPPQLAEDLSLLRTALQEGHPGLTRYTRQTTLDSAFASAAAEAKRPMKLREFHLLVCRLVSSVRDGHTVAVLPKADQDSLDAGRTALPFRAFLSEGQLYVRHNYSDLPDSVFSGSRLVAINGHPMAEFLATFHRFAPRDGANTTHEKWTVERTRLLTRYFTYVYGRSESYQITFVPRGADRERTETVPGLLFDDVLARFQQRYSHKSNQPPADFRYVTADQVALLRVSDFDKDQYADAKLNFSTFLADTFQRLHTQGTRNLILDLRDNRGGTDEYGEQLASHLIDHDYTYYSSLEMNALQYRFFAFTTNATGFKAPKGFAQANAHGGFNLIRHPNLGTRHPARENFRGNLIVLINGGCFSTASELLTVLAENTLARFVGEESGGAFGGNCSGPTPTLLLQNSRIRVEIPLVRYNMAVSGRRPLDRGLVPDVVVTPTLDDVLNGRDPVLDAGMRLLGEP